jgi:hypothetical protein
MRVYCSGGEIPIRHPAKRRCASHTAVLGIAQMSFSIARFENDLIDIEWDKRSKKIEESEVASSNYPMPMIAFRFLQASVFLIIVEGVILLSCILSGYSSARSSGGFPEPVGIQYPGWP